jgi:formate hydrogenlyase subunit 3/multisubunit Na+/H+ antiporter MnhD subunit
VPDIKIRPLTIVFLVAALVCFFIAVIYLIDTAAKLPAFFPGHDAGSSHHHVKHAIAFFMLGAAALFGAWFTTNPETSEK